MRTGLFALTLLAASSALLTSTLATAQTPEEKRKDLLALFEAAGVSAQVNQISQIMMSQQAPVLESLIRSSATGTGGNPDARIVPIMMEEVQKGFGTLSATILERMIPEWESRFTSEEIRELKAFYVSPVGKKLTTTMPGLLQRGAEIGQQVGQEIGQKAAEQAMVRYKKLPPAK